MTRRRRRNGWARNRGRSLGSIFGAWSATTYCVRWLQDPVPRLCAKFGELRPTFNEISSWSSITPTQVDPCIKKDVLLEIWLNWVWDGILGLSNKMIQWSFCVDPTPKSSSPHAKQGDTLGHFRDILIHWPKKPLGCCWSQQSLSISGFWMLYDGPASRVEKILALKPLCGKRWSSVFIGWRSKSLFRALVSPPVMKNETKSMIGITKLICCFPKWADNM